MLANLTTRHHQIAIVLVALVAMCGCEPPGKPNPANRPKLPDQITSFDELFSTNCTGCHGANGEMGPAPPLNDPLFVAIIPDEELLSIIHSGRPGTPMPPFSRSEGGSLTDEQVKIIADGIKSKWKPEKPLSPNPPGYALSSAAPGRTASGNRERGAQIYTRACAGCHGPNGAGVEHEGKLANAINVPAFLALISDQALRRIIITGRPDLGMPNFAEHDGRPDDFQPLTSADVDDLVALLADWRATGGSVVQNPNQ